MIELGDYIGVILSEITKARVIADKESLEIAELYAKDPLLKNFPVPRVRLPKVEIELPIVIENTELSLAIDTSLLKNNRVEILQSLRNSIYSKVQVSNKNLSDEEKKSVETLSDTAYDAMLDSLSKGTDKEVAVTNFITELETPIEAIIRKQSLSATRKVNVSLIENKVTSIKKTLNDLVKKELLEKIKVINNDSTKLNRVGITPISSEIKSYGTDNLKSITSIKLSIIEDSVEWVKGVNENGEEVSSLIME